jgi:hypothetical protein
VNRLCFIGIFRRCLLLVAVLLQFGYTQASDLPQGDVRLNSAIEGPVWVGQELMLNLDLMSTGVSFGGQQFSLPEVKGAYLMQPGSNTVKLTERQNGETWQILRYSLSLYPQREGRLEIPAIEVRFNASGGYGQPSESFRFSTKALPVEARMPPGVSGDGMVVTTTQYEQTTSWDPRLPVSGPLVLKVGDAVTLTVSRRANSVPGMVFPPLPDIAIEGLGVYQDAPRINDTVNRGELAGSRTDSITFICEREGDFEIPGMRFQWWEPDREVLNEDVVPALHFEVAANPAFDQPVGKSSAAKSFLFSWKFVFPAVTGLAILTFFGWRFAGPVGEWLRHKKAEREASEKWAFRRALKACSSGNAAGTYNAITIWLSEFTSSTGNKSLMQLAKISCNRQLAQEARRLQEAVVSGSDTAWNGRDLGRLLRGLRKELHRNLAVTGVQKERIKSELTLSSLPPLNPG